MAKPRRLGGGGASVESRFDKITGICPVPDASPTSSMSSPISLPEHAVEAFEVMGEHERVPYIVSLPYFSKAFNEVVKRIEKKGPYLASPSTSPSRPTSVPGGGVVRQRERDLNAGRNGESAQF